MKTRSERDQQQMTQCIYTIPCECGRSYIGETSRLLAVQLHECGRSYIGETGRLLAVQLHECGRSYTGETGTLLLCSSMNIGTISKRVF
jgi:hypothetical protein